MRSSATKILWQMWPRLTIIDGILRRRFDEVDRKTVRWSIVLPRLYGTEFMKFAHEGMTGGHFGYAKMAAAIQLRGYWPTWKSDLTFFLKQCESCSRYYRGKVKRQTPLQTPHVGEPWERVSIDITGPHPKSSAGKQFILTLVDHFSKWAEAIAIPNHTAITVARTLMTHVFCKYGAPKQLLSDRGPEFESELFTELMKWMEIDKLHTTPYKPSTNAACERFHRTLNSMLGKVVKETQRDWDQRLPQVMAAYRASPHSSTGYTPNRLFLGRETRMPLDLVMGTPEEDNGEPISMDAYIQNVKENTEMCYELARKELRVAAERRKKTYDIRMKKVEFAVGDWVWYWYPRRYTQKSPKWQKMYVGPYLIVRVIEPVNYVIQKSLRTKPIVVHGDKLKRCYGNTPVTWVNSDDVTQDQQEKMMSPNVESNREDSTESVMKPQTITKTRSDVVDNDISFNNHDTSQTVKQRPRRGNRQSPMYLRNYQW